MYILLIICFLVLVTILFFTQKNEHFEGKNVYAEKNVFVNNKQKLDIDNINVNRLCIKDEKGLECISKSELFNALELPIFRKHTFCIDDACISKNNIKKIRGDSEIKFKSFNDESKCLGFSNIPASLSLRTQKKWETDRIGLRVGIDNTDHPEYNRISYHSLYEPKDGWVLKPKDYCNKKHTSTGKEGLCDQKHLYPTKGYCKKGYGKYDYDDVKKYGCNTRHRSSPGVCWESAGRRCYNLRNIRMNSINNYYRAKDRTQVDSDMQDIPPIDLPTLINKDCENDSETETDNSMNFKLDVGKLKTDITGLIGSQISTKTYKDTSLHETHPRLIPKVIYENE